MIYDEIIEKLEALVEQYDEDAPKEIKQKFSGTIELYVDESDHHFLRGLERALELVHELKDENAQ